MWYYIALFLLIGFLIGRWTAPEANSYNPWRMAIEDALAVRFISYQLSDDPDLEEIAALLQQVCFWDVDVALNPNTSERARALQATMKLPDQLDEAINGCVADLETLACGRDFVIGSKLTIEQMQDIALAAHNRLNKAWAEAVT